MLKKKKSPNSHLHCLLYKAKGFTFFQILWRENQWVSLHQRDESFSYCQKEKSWHSLVLNWAFSHITVSMQSLVFIILHLLYLLYYYCLLLLM
jgi:hypothetical protein